MNLKIIAVIILVSSGLFVYQQYQKKTQVESQEATPASVTNTVTPATQEPSYSQDQQEQTQNDFTRNYPDSSQRQNAGSDQAHLRKNEQKIRNVREEAIRNSPQPTKFEIPTEKGQPWVDPYEVPLPKD